MTRVEKAKRIGEILIEMNAATAAQITEALAQQFGYPYIDLKNFKVAEEILQTEAVMTMVAGKVAFERNAK